ncbi:syntaxin-8 [Lingula anatina]|uniref:Syntaxin-8 n=1 Tax=Lingula anatina TaxID=7574 RepID=A0A1S3JF84_LINAN|nr:syntaxin-8 [Lingula anatina]|eukprot:XP_013408554.1 syntaxin-8 [Lingula anatina]
MAGDMWLSEYDSCAALAQDILQRINERNRHDRTSAQYTKLSGQIRSMIRQFSNDLNRLKVNLSRTAMYGLTEREKERRQSSLDELMSKEKQIDQAFNLQRQDSGAGRSALLGAGPAGWNSDPWGVREEPEAIRGMSVDEIKQQQQHLIKAQDHGLDSLADVVAKQKRIALDIGDEVDHQDEILDDIHDHMDTTNQRLITETRHIRIVDRKSGACGMWVVIVLLFIAIVVIAVVPYDGKP